MSKPPSKPPSNPTTMIILPVAQQKLNNRIAAKRLDDGPGRLQRKRLATAGNAAGRTNNIAVFDCETNPFDHIARERIVPFLGVIYADEFEPIVIWDDDFEQWKIRMQAAFESLPDAYTIYAHNGGKFDFTFLMHLFNGSQLALKGSRLMRARFGRHEFRDSYCILPVPLRDIAKDDMDYQKLRPEVRHEHRDEIIKYCISDCSHLLPVIKRWRANHGGVLTVGGAASKLLAKSYEVETYGDFTDNYIRTSFFHGGRVELFRGKMDLNTRYKLYDVNSMYPHVMASYQHPISNDIDVHNDKYIRKGTAFLDITCDNNGALLTHDDAGHLTASVKHGRFCTTIHEFRVAKRLGLIDNVKIHRTLVFRTWTDFAKYVIPLYTRRAEIKELLELDHDNLELHREALEIKLLLNNAYGRFAINPRKFTDSVMRDYDAPAPDHGKHAPYTKKLEQIGVYTIWSRPALRQKYANVATGASITGAARSVLLEAIHNAVDPIYCDTDSILCKDLPNTELHRSKLGAWKYEGGYDSILLSSKKEYWFEDSSGICKPKYAYKGSQGLLRDDIHRLVYGETDLPKSNLSPTMKLDGRQEYQTKNPGLKNKTLTAAQKHVSLI